MTIMLPLQPQEEARLLAMAKAKGLSPDAIVREALDRVLTEQSGSGPVAEDQKSDARPIWDVILENMKDVPPEAFAQLPKDGASEIDHYLYGHPKHRQ
jgi:hypothetical protein